VIGVEEAIAVKHVPLREAAEINPKVDRALLSEDTLVSFVPMAAVGAADGQIDVSTTRPYAEVNKGYTAFRNGDVLFAKVTPCMENGKMAVARNLSNGQGFGSTEFHVLRPREGVDSSYLYHFVSSATFRKEAARHMTGAVGLRRVPSAFLQDELIPLPELDEQRRIVAEIEKQFSRLDEAVANLQRVKANLKRYKAAVLKAAVEGRLVETGGEWSSVVLGDVALSVRNGCSVKPDADSGTRILRISAVRPLELSAEDVRFLPGTVEHYAPFDVNAGDVLFTRYNGSRDYVGVCAVVPERMTPTIYPDKLIRVRVDKEKVLPEFLAIACSAGQGRDFIKSKIRTTAGQSGVSGADIKAIPVSVPPIAEQESIVAEADRRLSVLRNVEAEVNANLQRAQALRQSVLTRSFLQE
jgi:type I restriction enzyme S subunit